MRTPKSILVMLCSVLAAVTFTANAQAQDIVHITLLNQKGKTAANFESDVEDAGGTLIAVVEEIGVAFVSSSDPDFKSVLEKIKGVQQVGWVPPLPTEEVTGHAAPQVAASDLGEGVFWYPAQWGLTAVNAQEAWSKGYTGEGARVAVLDSGIAHQHPDLVDNIDHADSATFLPCYYGSNCDGDGYEDWRVLDIPDFNHGTHVAGTIAASGKGGQVLGVAPDAEIIAVKVCSEFDTYCYDEAIIPGIVHAANVGADIINMSLGGLSRTNGKVRCEEYRDLFDDPEMSCGEVAASDRVIYRAYSRAFRYAEAHNSTIIVSAGNSGLDGNAGNYEVDGEVIHNQLFLFADFPNVVSISAVAPVGHALPSLDPTDGLPDEPLAGPDTLTYYSNYGRSLIDFAAPGGTLELGHLYGFAPAYPALHCSVDGIPLELPCFWFDLVVSTIPGDSIYFAAGTSMAAPHAAGVAAIIVGMNGGDLSPQELRNAMKRSAEDLGTPGHDEVFGDGHVNAGNAVQ